MKVLASGILALCLLSPQVTSAADNDSDYTVGPSDVLNIAVWRHPDLSGTFTVGSDGAITIPLLGAVDLNGKTVREVEVLVTHRLAEGFVREPQVTVSVQTYRSKSVYVTGEVRQPGTFTLTGPLTLLEAVARAGSVTEYASNDAIVVRGGSGHGAADPGAAPAETIHVDLRELQKGHLAGNLVLRDGDTVLVPRASTVHVMGEVRQPGDYSIVATTTLVEVLSRAGGATERGSIERVRVVRLVKGKKKQIKAHLEDPLQPGDIVIVRERLF